MKYIRKTKDVYEVQGYYSPQYGYECVTSEETYKEAKLRLRNIGIMKQMYHSE